MKIEDSVHTVQSFSYLGTIISVQLDDKQIEAKLLSVNDLFARIQDIVTGKIYSINIEQIRWS